MRLRVVSAPHRRNVALTLEEGMLILDVLGASRFPETKSTDEA